MHFRRKLNIASWDELSDPQTYLPEEYDMTKTSEYIKKINDYSK